MSRAPDHPQYSFSLYGNNEAQNIRSSAQMCAINSCRHRKYAKSRAHATEAGPKPGVFTRAGKGRDEPILPLRVSPPLPQLALFSRPPCPWGTCAFCAKRAVLDRLGFEYGFRSVACRSMLASPNFFPHPPSRAPLDERGSNRRKVRVRTSAQRFQFIPFSHHDGRARPRRRRITGN